MLASETCAGCTVQQKTGGLSVVSFGILGILYSEVMVAIAALAVYALVLVIIFLRLRIKELRTAPLPGPDKGS